MRPPEPLVTLYQVSPIIMNEYTCENRWRKGLGLHEFRNHMAGTSQHFTLTSRKGECYTEKQQITVEDGPNWL